jgi:glutathione S-transferase
LLWVCRSGAIGYRTSSAAAVRSGSPEGEDLTAQRRVPVLVHGDEVTDDSNRILEYLDWLDENQDWETAPPAR